MRWLAGCCVADGLSCAPISATLRLVASLHFIAASLLACIVARRLLPTRRLGSLNTSVALRLRPDAGRSLRAACGALLADEVMGITDGSGTTAPTLPPLVAGATPRSAREMRSWFLLTAFLLVTVWAPPCLA